jgi:hypothetical protein
MTLLSFSLLGSPHWVRYLRTGGAGIGQGTYTGYAKHYATLHSTGKFSIEKWDSGRMEVGERGHARARMSSSRRVAAEKKWRESTCAVGPTCSTN